MSHPVRRCGPEPNQRGACGDRKRWALPAPHREGSDGWAGVCWPPSTRALDSAGSSVRTPIRCSTSALGRIPK